MKIKIISDLHLSNPQQFNIEENCDLLVIAGDLSSKYQLERDFLKQLRVPTVCVAGNHLGYEYGMRNIISELLYLPMNHLTLESEILNLQEYFKCTNIHYLQNEYFKFDNKIIFGGTMYTDFTLYGNQNESMNIARQCINDFSKVYVSSNPRRVTPEDYVRYFNTFMRRLKKCIKETSEDIIVVTHFAPSKKAISNKYKNNELNPYFVTDLEKFIENNKRIKLWIHGHVHNQCSYNVGDCKVVCNPFGYFGENYIDTKDYEEVIVEV